MQTINRNKAKELIKESKGKIFNASFIKFRFCFDIIFLVLRGL